MSTERELLELAAKAAGIKTGPYPSAGGALWDESDPQNHRLWNPIEDDGDALRLAVKLEMMVDTVSRVVAGYLSDVCIEIDYDEQEEDPEAATRLAIVRAAAEIGRQMG